jgi:hypothetical protein
MLRSLCACMKIWLYSGLHRGLSHLIQWCCLLRGLVEVDHPGETKNARGHRIWCLIENGDSSVLNHREHSTRE